MTASLKKFSMPAAQWNSSMVTSCQCFARRVKLEFRNLRNSLNQQRSATVHGVVFDVFVELARQVGARSTLGKAGCAMLTAGWQQGPATTIS
ncbi:hypothetical protein [Bradyrhizobium sp. 139]|uniref:hypothetical protein n=1 Tax=Bradyrhizobium sp. 139 TaxID=2782616 RepID=UPI001FF7F898|nr:hypothetical protein [Bradyrhizobium sp. 139]